MREGDNVLLQKKNENKLSPCYEKEPYPVIFRYGNQVVLQSPQGVQVKSNLQHIKPLNMPDPKEQETPLQDAEPRTQLSHLRRHPWQRIKYQWLNHHQKMYLLLYLQLSSL